MNAEYRRLSLIILISSLLLAGCIKNAEDIAHQEELLKKEQMNDKGNQAVSEADKEKAQIARDLEILRKEERIEISLPWSKEEEIIGLLPLGETEIHQPPGHPGICVGWTHNAKIIASADGIISIMEDDEIDGSGLSIVKQISGQYIISYKHINANPELKQGAAVKKGDLIGYPMAKPEEKMTNYAFHWDIYPNIKTERISLEGLCPLAYLDDESRERLEEVWSKDPSEYKKRWPKICNGYYDGLDSFIGFYNRSFNSKGELIKPDGEIVGRKS